jgi:metallo-beta-lactamase class B
LYGQVAPIADTPQGQPATQIDAAQAAPVTGFAMRGAGMHRSLPFTIAETRIEVGTETLALFLLTTLQGHLLIDGVQRNGPADHCHHQALALILRSELLNTHAHIDQGGLRLQRASVDCQRRTSGFSQPVFIDHGRV